MKRRQPKTRAAKPAGGRRRRGKWRSLLLALPLALVIPFAAGYFVAVFVLFPAREVSGAGIPVPDLAGVSAAEAQRMLAAAGLGELQILELPHPQVPSGQVLAQDPLPGQQLRAGAGVRIALSAGRPRAPVPDVAGYSAARAQSLLERAGFTVNEITQESAVAAGRVVRTEPRAGQQATLPAEVTVIVSSGLAVAPVDTVQDLLPDMSPVVPPPLTRPDTIPAGASPL